MTNLTLKEVQEKNVRCSVNLFNMPLENWSLMQWGCALGGETGEALNVAKKIERDGMSPKLYQQLSDELADALTYLALMASAANIDLETAFLEKFEIVSERQKAKMEAV